MNSDTEQPAELVEQVTHLKRELRRWHMLAYKCLPKTDCDRDDVAALEAHIADLTTRIAAVEGSRDFAEDCNRLLGASKGRLITELNAAHEFIAACGDCKGPDELWDFVVNNYDKVSEFEAKEAQDDEDSK